MFCDRCGRPRSLGNSSGDPAPADHTDCDAARRLEPPRYCPACARRMVVQVLPTGWSARCVEHGSTASVPV